MIEICCAKCTERRGGAVRKLLCDRLCYCHQSIVGFTLQCRSPRIGYGSSSLLGLTSSSMQIVRVWTRSSVPNLTEPLGSGKDLLRPQEEAPLGRKVRVRQDH